jgi:CBS domain-containing protein
MKKSPKHPNRLGIKIREIMTRDVVTIGSKSSVADAAAVMRDRDVGMLPVCDGGKILGIITDRDITVRVVAGGHDPKKVKVLQMMTPEVVYSYDHEDVLDAIEGMEERQIRRNVVLNRRKKLVGVISLGDVAVDIGNQALAGEALQMVSAPEQARAQ